MVRPTAMVGTVGLLAIAVALIYSTGWAQQTPTPPATTAAGPPAGAFGRGGRGGGGGGGVNPYGITGPLPGQAIYAANCLGCHGNDLTGGRAPTLFAERWQAETSDADMTDTIRNGVPATEMGSYKTKLSDDQIAELVKYIRSQSGVLKPRQTVGADPNGVILKTEKQTVKIEVVTRGSTRRGGCASCRMDACWSPSATSTMARCASSTKAWRVHRSRGRR